MRVFDVLAEDFVILDHIDLVSAGSGVAFTALTVSAPFIEVNDGFLDLKVGRGLYSHQWLVLCRIPVLTVSFLVDLCSSWL
jgi:hypothetical protein